MGRVNTPILSSEARQALEKGYKTGTTHAYRVRCRTILLKSDGLKSKEVGKMVGMSHVSVNSWLQRYKLEGISGLFTKAGRGRKPIIDKTKDVEAILEAVKSNRQRLQTAKAAWEEKSKKSVSRDTFRTFLKVLADDIKE
jgi:transposase